MSSMEQIVTYFKDAYKNDPFRILLEIFLAILAAKYLTSKNVKTDSSRLKLSEKVNNLYLPLKEVNDLISDWDPVDLVPANNNVSLPETFGDENVCIKSGNSDFCGLLAAKDAVRIYGVGTCGPPGFYGTLDVHSKLETALAKFFGAENAILYAQGYSAVSSVIPAFAKRGDVIIADEMSNSSILSGMKISRSYIYYFKHNDIDDLERLLIEAENRHSSQKFSRRFIITESLFQSTGKYGKVKDIINIKKKFNYRLIVDNSLGLGVTGINATGLECIDPTDVDIIVGSLANVVGAAGGYCAAALPSLLAIAALQGISKISNHNLTLLRQKVKLFRQELRYDDKKFEVRGDEESPLLHLVKLGANQYRDLNQIHSILLENGINIPVCKISSPIIDGEKMKFSLKVTLTINMPDYEVVSLAEKITTAINHE